MTKVSGYVGATHEFGRSSLIRASTKQTTYYLKWQWRKDTAPFSNLIVLTKQEYTYIKSLLGPIIEEQKDITPNGNHIITYFHDNNHKYYMRVRRYLKKRGNI